MLDLMQEAAGRDASVLGFGYDEMISENTAWVLSRTRVCFHKCPKWRDSVVLKTWHKGANRIFYLRDFLLESPEGELLISATTSWLIIDLATRRMVRNTTLAENFDNSEMGDAIEEQAGKVMLPKGLEPELVHTHKVVWSDIDTNGHVNNVKYAVWALDAVDYDILKEKSLKEMLINYDTEVMRDQTVELYRVVAQEEESTVVYIVGKVEGKSCFSIKMNF
jgi:acyl-ACP thioesterase